MSTPDQLSAMVEAILFTSTESISAKKLHALLNDKEGQYTLNDIKTALSDLQTFYQNRGVALQETAGGFRFHVVASVMPWVLQARAEKPPRLSPAFLETLAIIAYRQPVTRADIESVRGVSVSSNILRQMLDRGWVKVVGHKEVPGRPGLLATTTQFLDDFGLKRLTELPALADLKPLATAEQLHLLVDSPSAQTDVSNTTKTDAPSVTSDE